MIVMAGSGKIEYVQPSFGRHAMKCPLSSFRLLFSAALLVCAHSITARTLFVDAANPGREEGTQEHPFRSIEPAMEMATEGDTIMIAAGRYMPDGQEIRIPPGVALIGESAESTIIDAMIRDPDAGSGVAVSLINLTFTAFEFARGESNGPFVGVNTLSGCICQSIRISHGATYDSLDHRSHSFSIEGNRVRGSIEIVMGSVYGGIATVRNNECGEIVVGHAGSPDTIGYSGFQTIVENNTVAGVIRFHQGAGSELELIRGNRAGAILIKSGGFWTYDISRNDLDSGIIDNSGVCWTTIANNVIRDGIIYDASGSFEDSVESQIIEENTVNYSGRSFSFEYIAPEQAVAAVVNQSKSATVRNNHITSAISGCYFASGGPTNIIDNTIIVPTLTFPFTSSDSLICGIRTIAGFGYVTGNTITGGFIGYQSSSGAVLFSDNTIAGAHTGALSVGRERFRNNTITGCSGDGMVLNGARGPVEMNRITDNAGAGMRVLRAPIDLGGGADSSAGLNILQRNGDYDLFINTTGDSTGKIYARNNYWDHATAGEIDAIDIYDGRDADSLAIVDFSPFGVMSVRDANRDGTDMGLNVIPNPVADHGTIAYRLPHSGHVRLRLFDLIGRERALLVDGHQEEGDHGAPIGMFMDHARRLPAGVYWCMLTLDGKCVVRQFTAQ